MNNSFYQALVLLAALLCTEIIWAGNAMTEPVTSVSEADGLVRSLDHLFKRENIYRMVVHPEQPDVLQITRTDSGANSGSLTNVVWCGSRLLRFHYGHYDYDDGEKVPPDHGWYLADIQSRKVWRLRKLPGGGELVNCSPDGQWLIYKRIFHGRKVILGRYNVASGMKEDFVRFKDPFSTSLGEWSPDGTKILFYGKSDLVSIKTSAPVWNIFWVKRDLSLNGLEVIWLSDSSGVLLRYQSDPKNNSSKRILGIDHTGDPAQPIEMLKNAPSDFNRLKTDIAGHIYGMERMEIGAGRALTQLQRCVSENKFLKCERAIPGDPNVSLEYAISLDGKVIYYSGDDEVAGISKHCLWQYERSVGKKTCIVIRSQMYGISPDGRYIALDMATDPSGFGVLNIQFGNKK
jgi:hypothetical protein